MPSLQRLRQVPRHLLVCEKGHARDARSRHAAHVRDHAYNCRVSAPARREQDGVLTGAAVGGREEGSPVLAVAAGGSVGRGTWEFW